MSEAGSIRQGAMDFGVPERDRVDEARLREMRAVTRMTNTRAWDEERQTKPNTRATQCDRVLALLRSRPVVTLPELLDLRIANYRARISDIRRMGFDVRCHKETVDGITHSRYTLAGREGM